MRKTFLTNHSFDSHILFSFFNLFFIFIPNRDSFDSAQFWWLSWSFLPGGVKNTCLIATPCCYKYSVLGSQGIPFNAHAENVKTDSPCGLVSKLLSGFETKIACQLTGHCNFCFPLTANPSAQTQVGCCAVTSSHRCVANVLRTVWDFLCIKEIHSGSVVV